MTLRETESASERIEGVLRNLANTSDDCDVIEDIVAARLFASVQQIPEIGRFKLLGLIGSGAMGTVYVANDPELGRKVAIKVVRTSSESVEPPATARARLTREARILARLSHPNIVTIHETGIHADDVFVVMEFIEGESLGEWATGQRAWREIVEMYVQAGEGLAAAHALGLVHRDFKPANVLVGSDGRPRVVDFGLARVVDPQRLVGLDYSVTMTGRVCGTPGYMAPELLTGTKASPQTDLYAYCIALLEALRPVSAEQTNQPTVPEPILDVLLRGLAPDPAARWPTMDALLGELRRASEQARPGRHRLRILGLLLLALACVAMFGLWVSSLE